MADYSKCSLLYYQGKYYMSGTKVKVRDRLGKEQIVTFLHDHYYSPAVPYASMKRPEEYIIEIVEPIYYNPPSQKHKKTNIFFRTGSGSAEHDDEVFHGFLLYLFVMIVACIFNGRLKIWMLATLIYFAWKKKL